MLNDLIFVLAVWRVSRLLMTDDGPFDIFLRLRTKVGAYNLQNYHPTYGEAYPRPESNLGRLLHCIYCTSLWVSIGLMVVLYLLHNLPDLWLARMFAYSGAAVLIDLEFGD